MNTSIENFKTGWYGVVILIKPVEIDELIERLQELKTKKTDHFHLVSDYKAESGIGDVEFALQGAEPDNMQIML